MSDGRYLTTDDVVWWPEQNRWVGRTSSHLLKKVRIAAALAHGATIPLNCEGDQGR